MAKAELDVAEMVEETFEKHFGVTLDRLRELAEADKDGRCVIMPCKVGDIVWIFHDVFTSRLDGKPMRCAVDEFSTDRNNTYAVLNGCEQFYAMRRFKAVDISEFGKTVFLTREAALEAQNET